MIFMMDAEVVNEGHHVGRYHKAFVFTKSQ